MLIDEKKLSLYIKNNLNVLFEGERGVGKTATIHKAFQEAGLRVKYFSAPTMDPWTDLVGVPTTVTRADGKEVLRMVQPEDFVDDNYDVIFIDELNRAQPKVLNALMELIQFGTINGKEYGIKMIWAAINPWTEDGDYTVEKLDLAVKDRFQVQIKFPYKVDHDLFKKTFSTTGSVFADWWTNQPENVKKEISPRRLFEAAKFYLVGGDVEDILMTGNLEKLKESLKSQTQLQILEQDFKNKSITGSKTILSKPLSKTVSDYLEKNIDKLDFFFNEISDEWLSKEFSKNGVMYKNILSIADAGDNKKAVDLVKSIVATSKQAYINSRKEDLEKYLPKDYYENIKKEQEARSIKKQMSPITVESIANSMPVKNALTEMFVSYNYLSFSSITNLNNHFNKTQIKRSMASIRSKYQATQPDNYNKVINAVALRVIAILSDFETNVILKQNKPSVVYNDLVTTILSKEKDGMFSYKKGGEYVNDVADLVAGYGDVFKGLSTEEIKKKHNSAMNNKQHSLMDILYPIPKNTVAKKTTSTAKKNKTTASNDDKESNIFDEFASDNDYDDFKSKSYKNSW